MKPADGASVRVDSSSIHGRGVHAVRSFVPGETIERCPVLVVPASQRRSLAKTMLAEYYFCWGDDAAIALGCGSLYNHSYRANATFTLHTEQQLIAVVAWLYIAAGEEITINYNGAPGALRPVWFDEES